MTVPHTWFRLYSEVLNDPKVQRLPANLFKFWINLMCISSKNGSRGVLPAIEDIAFSLHLSVKKATDYRQKLVEAQLLDIDRDGSYRCHNWERRQFESEAGSVKNEGKYVYLMKAPQSPLVKVGFSKNPWARLIDVRNQSDTDLKLIATYRSSAVSEVQLHILLSEFHKEDEWFAIPQALLEVMIGLAKRRSNYDELLRQLRSRDVVALLRRTTTPDTDTDTDIEKKEKKARVLLMGPEGEREKTEAPKRIPLDDEETQQIARRLGLDHAGLEEEMRACLDHHKASGECYRDWIARFRGWLRRKEHLQKMPKGVSNNGKRESVAEHNARVEEEIHRRFAGGFLPDDRPKS